MVNTIDKRIGKSANVKKITGVVDKWGGGKIIIIIIFSTQIIL